MEPDSPSGVQAGVRRLNWTTWALMGGLVLFLVVIAYFATRGSGNQDKLANANLSSSTVPSREKLCASQTTYVLIKRDLFRRAAQLRGSDQAAYDQISTTAVLRMENPVMESEDGTTGAVHCSGSLSLDLPPGLAVVGGRRTLSADVDYSIQEAADGSGPVVLLSNADPIVSPLATVGRVAQPTPPAAAPAVVNTITPQGTISNEAGPSQLQAAAPPAQQAARAAAPPVPRPSAANPSFSCAKARSSSEIAICAEPRLAALDRSMATEYRQATGVATPEQRDLLRQTAHRFYAYRDRCTDRQCIAAAYAGRVREMRDIIESRWQPPR